MNVCPATVNRRWHISFPCAEIVPFAFSHYNKLCPELRPVYLLHFAGMQSMLNTCVCTCNHISLFGKLLYKHEI